MRQVSRVSDTQDYTAKRCTSLLQERQAYEAAQAAEHCRRRDFLHERSRGGPINRSPIISHVVPGPAGRVETCGGPAPQQMQNTTILFRRPTSPRRPPTPAHIPWRDSPLTQLLRNLFLTPHPSMIFLITLSPNSLHQSVQSLRFAETLKLLPSRLTLPAHDEHISRRTGVGQRRRSLSSREGGEQENPTNHVTTPRAATSSHSSSCWQSGKAKCATARQWYETELSCMYAVTK